ncbi:MAG: metallophosphoesterase [Methanomassiliicoccales archaeon]
MEAINWPGVALTSDGCVTVNHGETLVIADLHIGYEGSLEEAGLHLPKVQTDDLRDRLLAVMDKYEPSRIVVLGDFKHEFSRNLSQEWRDVRSILSFMGEYAEVVLVRGNHDNYLATITSRMDIPLLDSYRVGDLTLVHGHRDCAARPLVMGHEHPSVKIRDSVGASIKLPCFLRWGEVLVLPAFSPLSLGTDLSVARPSDFLSPVLRGRDVSGSAVYACSEIGLLSLGRLGDMMETIG